ncbi:MAG TPA: MEDS domain-containing protein [Verrucomicrobiae bacterium]
MKSSLAENEKRAAKADASREKIVLSGHVVQFYNDDTTFLDSLCGFIAEGLKAGEAAIVIATASHRASLEFRLRALGFNVPDLIRDDRYVAVDAEETLAKLIIDSKLDERVFKQLASQLLARAKKSGRAVRAFGEMVAILWSKGNKTATTSLEKLWNEFRRTEDFQLFCAYPSNGFDKDSALEIQEICSAHSKVIMSRRSGFGHPQS